MDARSALEGFPAMVKQNQQKQQFRTISGGNAKNELKELDSPIHRWWRFVLAFPPHLVTQYLDEFGCDGPGRTVFDPFSGTGTTLVEAKRRGCHAVGTEALDFCYLASKVKTTWDLPLPSLERASGELLEAVAIDFAKFGFFLYFPRDCHSQAAQLSRRVARS
jgi:hypothetical protein